MLMRFSSFAAVIFFLAIFPLHAQESRTWTDSTGKFKIEATFVDLDIQTKTVKLKKADGKTVSLALDKLCEDDQVMAMKLFGELAFQGNDPSNPFAGGSDEETVVEPASGAKFTGKPIVIRLSKNRDLRTNNADTTWSIEPDPAKTQKLAFRPKGTTLPVKKTDFGTHLSDKKFFFCDDIPDRVLGVVQLSQMSNKKTILFLADLKQSSSKPVLLPVELEPYGLSPNGKLALFRQKTEGSGFGLKKTLAIADAEDPGFKCVKLFEPFTQLIQHGSNIEADIEWAAWVDNEHVLTMASRGEVLLFNINTAQPIWGVTSSSLTKPIFSPTRKYLVLPSQTGQLFLINAIAGEVIGRLETPEGARFNMAKGSFSPDGATLAIQQDDMLYRWNIADGKSQEPFYTGRGFNRPLWIDTTFLMVNGTLIDAKADVILRYYQGTDGDDQTYAGYYWVLRNEFSAKSANCELLPYTIPHVKLKPREDIPDEKRYCILPGMKVKLQVDSGIPDSGKVSEYLRGIATKNGLTIADDAEIVLTAKMTAQPVRKVSYSSGMFRSGAEVQYTPYKMSIGFEKGEEVLWERVAVTSQPSVSVEEIANQSLQDVVTRKSQPASGWYLQTTFPPKIPMIKIGTSTIGISGITDEVGPPRGR